MPKVSINLLLWSAHLHEGLLPVVESLREMGYDGVEIPLFDLECDYAAWGKRLDDLQLGRTGLVVRTAEDDPMSADPAIRRKGIDATCRALDCCAAVGATHLVGPLHSALGTFSGAGATEEEWKRSVDSVRKMAEHAGSVNVTLAIEPLNRFETYLLTTHADADRFVAEVDHPACGVMYDTFHANIEEKSMGQAIRDCAASLVHVHLSENDRSTPGAGHIAWDEVFDTLAEIDYDGWLAIEAFGQAMPELAAATKIWRRMFASEEDLARGGLEFVRTQLAARKS